MTLVLGLAVALFALGMLGVPKALSMDADDFMAPVITSCVNGLFISIVFLSHAKDYVPEEAFGPLDEGCLKVVSYLGQLMVTTFLFYSGFGAMESIKHKPGYIKAFPARRILPFLLDVWIALAVYLVLLPIRGGQTNVETVLLAMVGWKSLGNSNWYIFAILAMWVATYVAFRVFPDEKQRPLGVALVTVLSLLYAWVLRHDEIGSHFYKTIVCYPAGMALSLVVERVRSLKLDSLRMLPVWALLFVGSVAALVYLHGKRGSGLSWYFAMTLAFCATALMLQMRMRHVSKPLYYAGRYLFFFYIYQRVPMFLLRPIATRGALPFVLACLVTGIPFCLLMARAHAAIKKRIFA